MSMGEIETFLIGAEKSYQEELAGELVAEDLKVAVDESLDTNGIPTAFRFGAERQEFLALTAEADVRERIYEDGVLLKRIFLQVFPCRNSPDAADAVFAKKALSAELFVYAGCDSDSPWLKLPDDLLPNVQGIDFDSAEDMVFIGGALKDRTVREQKKQRFRDVVMGCLSGLMQAGEGDSIETDGYVQALNRCGLMYPMSDIHQAAATDELARDTGLSHKEIDALKKAYSEYYESTGGYFPVSLV